MKRIGYIYEKICGIENIKMAIMKASLGKRKRYYVRKVVENIDEYAMKIHEMLADKAFAPSAYRVKTILDGATKKQREIYMPRFYPDQIVHWALMLQIEPVIMRGMYEYSCGSVPGRGTSFGQKHLRRWLNNDYRGTKYCLKMDIEKFYPSVDNQTMKAMFRKKIKDNDCLWLIDTIIDSADGLPIGNYTSQWFSNYYLEGLDHFIKEALKIKYYIRYVDDLVLLGPNKKALHEARRKIEAYLASIHLRMKRNWQVFLVNPRGVDFLGFRFFRDKTVLRKRNALRIRRRIARIGRKSALNYLDACAIVSYWGWIKRSDSFNYYNKHIKPSVSIKYARRRVSYEDRFLSVYAEKA